MSFAISRSNRRAVFNLSGDCVNTVPYWEHHIGDMHAIWAHAVEERLN